MDSWFPVNSSGQKNGAPKGPVVKQRTDLENELRRQLQGTSVAGEGQLRVIEIHGSRGQEVFGGGIPNPDRIELRKASLTGLKNLFCIKKIGRRKGGLADIFPGI